MARETVRERKARLERGGDWLRGQRVQRSWTGVEFARRLGVDQAKLSAYENGRYEVDVSVARDIARVLEVPELEVWRGLQLPLPRELTVDGMSADEVISYVRRTFPGELERLTGETGASPEGAGQQARKPTRRGGRAKEITRPDEPGRSASHG